MLNDNGPDLIVQERQRYERSKVVCCERPVAFSVVSHWLGGHSRFMGGTTYLGTLVGDELGGHCYDMDMCEH